MNREARGGGNSNCRWAGILIVADHSEEQRIIDDPLGLWLRASETDGLGAASGLDRGFGGWHTPLLAEDRRDPKP